MTEQRMQQLIERAEEEARGEEMDDRHGAFARELIRLVEIEVRDECGVETA